MGYFMGPWVQVRPLGVFHACQPGEERVREQQQKLDRCLDLIRFKVGVYEDILAGDTAPAEDKASLPTIIIPNGPWHLGTRTRLAARACCWTASLSAADLVDDRRLTVGHPDEAANVSPNGVPRSSLR
jgi:hypothetical protein